MFSALDRAIDKAAEAGIRCVLTFSNMWKPVDGKLQYVAWVSANACGFAQPSPGSGMAP